MMEDTYHEEEVEYCEECGRRLSLCDCDEDEFDDLDYDEIDCCLICGLDEFECRCEELPRSIGKEEDY